MKKLVYLLALLIFSHCSSTQQDQKQVKSLVLVHGAHMSAEIWSIVSLKLRKKIDRPVISVNLPGRGSDKDITLTDMAKSLCKNLTSQSDILAHSQGGAVVNQALDYCSDKIGKIIYVSAVIPYPGEQPFEKLSRSDEKSYFKSVTFDAKDKILRVHNEKVFARTFAQDANRSQRKMIIRNIIWEPSLPSEHILDFPIRELREKKKYYIKTSKDLIISQNSQEKFLQRTKMKKVFTLDTGHLPMVTEPNKLVKIVLSIVE